MNSILVICHVYPPEHAPAGVMVAELAEDLAKRGYDVTVLTGWPSHPAGLLYPDWKVRWRSLEHDPHGFRVIRCAHSIHPRERFFWRLWYYLSFAISTLVSGWFTGRCDVVLSLSTPVFGNWAAWLLAKSKRARFVYGIFDMHPESAANAGLIRRGVAFRILKAADTTLCRHADAIVTLGEGLRAEIVARGIRPENVAVVPFWLDGRRIQPGPRDNPWRRDQGIGPETFVALYAGTIGHVSGAQVLIDTAILLAGRKDILILCVGGGPVRGRLVSEAARAGLQNIRFVPFQPAAVLDRVQASADVGLVTLLPEAGKSSLPSKILGYLAAGRPVIASVAAGSDTAQLIRVAGCGRVARCMDPADLADAIVNLADSASACEEYGRCGRAYFERVFDRPVCVGAYERILMNGSVKGEICL